MRCFMPWMAVRSRPTVSSSTVRYVETDRFMVGTRIYGIKTKRRSYHKADGIGNICVQHSFGEDMSIIKPIGCFHARPCQSAEKPVACLTLFAQF
jgi:hypothetical protein